MSEFGKEMMAQLDAYRNTAIQEEDDSPSPRPRQKKEVKYTCEVSGIDMIVSKTVGDKCTMKMYVCLSQPDADGNGTIFIKVMKGGVVKEGTVDNIRNFLKDLNKHSIDTESNVIPYLDSGNDFAEKLYVLKDKKYIDLIKEGLYNIRFVGESYRNTPWYTHEDGYGGNTSYGCKDRHAKLIRYCVEKLAKKYDEPYAWALWDSCHGREKCQSIWAFSMLADIYDEPYAMKCFDEYLDNERLGGLSAVGIKYLLYGLSNRDYCGTPYYNRYIEWKVLVKDLREGVNQITTLEKNRLWEFMQHAVAVGQGKRLDNYLQIYGDYILQAAYCDGKVRDKYPEHLQVAHDVYSEKYTLVKEFRDQEILAQRVAIGKNAIDQVHDGYQLKTLISVQDFLDEAQQNCNCVASYVDHVKAGKCWIASFRKVGDDVTQLTVEVDPHGEMVQIKGKYNREPTKDELHILDKFRNSIIGKLNPAAL